MDKILYPVIEISSLKQIHQNKVLHHTFPAEDEKKPTILDAVGEIIQNFGQQKKISYSLIYFNQSSLVHPLTVLCNFILAAHFLRLMDVSSLPPKSRFRYNFIRFQLILMFITLLCPRPFSFAYVVPRHLSKSEVC